MENTIVKRDFTSSKQTFSTGYYYFIFDYISINRISKSIELIYVETISNLALH